MIAAYVRELQPPIHDLSPRRNSGSALRRESDTRTRGSVQHIRDARIAAIYEGANGMQAMDLVGRKLQGDYRKAFANYERRLRPFIERKQKTAEKFASSFALKTAPGISLRVMAMRLMAFRPFAELFMGASLKDDFDLPDYGC